MVKNGNGGSPMTQAALARALDLSEPMVSKLKRRGMPTTSIAEAAAWRAHHLLPWLVKEIRRPELTAGHRTRDPVTRANEHGRLAYDALESACWSDFVRHVEAVRAAFLVIPDAEQDQALLPVQVWDALCGFPGPWSAHTHFERVN